LLHSSTPKRPNQIGRFIEIQRLLVGNLQLISTL